LALISVVSLSRCTPYADFRLPALGSPQTGGKFGFVPSKDPQLVPGPKGSFDSVDVLNPSVVHVNGTWYNFYSGYDGKTWHTGLATGPDGSTWSKQGKVLSPTQPWEGDYIAANGSALYRNGEFWYWYQANRTPPRIGLARSKDGRTWTREPAPVLDVGPRMAWDERGVADPYVIELDGVLYMYFLGQDRAHRQRLGVARSRDGIHWEKLLTNPILDLGEYGAFDERGLGEPAVWPQFGYYWMLYTARDRNEWRRIGLARSTDGVHWQRVSTEPFISGWAAWNEKVVCDPHVEVDNGRVRVWLGGGDRAQPAENLNGAIGYGELRHQ
ncbi:MAG TPA: hypothetical protein VE621_15055, partial [Bryobacteraceae bacterium]|nr:hypothetical protein [Bryobacteraceae bacterium]